GHFKNHELTMNLTQKINIFFKEVWVEMRRVSWLSRKEILRYTLIVLAVTIAVAAFLGGLDFILMEIIRNFLLR
ncbi:MAG: preprotein translocase subunit SecE, partial [bacterium]